jgi:acyl-CoA synthetase (AMP-forming)/AMP-acid ligase II
MCLALLCSRRLGGRGEFVRVPHVNFVSVLQHRVSENPEAKLYTFLDRNGDPSGGLSVGELYRKAVQLAVLLQSEGLVGQPVLLCHPHGPGFIIAFFGAVLAGAWPVPVARGRLMPWTSLLRLSRACRAHAILTTQERQHAIAASFADAAKLRILATDQQLPDWCIAEQRWKCPKLTGHDLAFIQYTSGSSSQPKGVMVTHENVLHNSARIQQAFKCGAADVGVSWLPFHHDMGLIGHIVQPLFAGIHNYFLNPQDFVANPLRWLRAISRYGGTISGGPDFAYAHSSASYQRASADKFNLNLGNWRIAYSGSERILPRTLQRFAETLRQTGFSAKAFFPCYGLAESTLFVSGKSGAPAIADSTNNGLSFQDVSLGVITDNHVAIVDPETEAQRNEGECGEIYLRSASVSPGYYLNQEETRRSFNRTVAGAPGYLRTGDIGRISRGNLYYHGRLKNLVKRRGEPFFCEDIETVVEHNLQRSGVRRCVAFGINTESEEALILMLEMNVSDLALCGALSVADVRAVVLDSCGVLPDDVRFVTRHTLPLTSSGKLRRAECKSLYRKITATLPEVCDA